MAAPSTIASAQAPAGGANSNPTGDNSEPWFFQPSEAVKGERRVLLLSNSTMKNEGFLAHCIDVLVAHFQGISTLTFVPFASIDWDGYTEKVRQAFKPFGINVVGIHEVAREDHNVPFREGLLQAEGILIGGGNTFLLQKMLVDHNLQKMMRARVWAGMPYAGSSAGTNVACVSINNTNDMPIVRPPTFAAMGLIPFNINAHYLDPSTDGSHNGETREQRISEFHGISNITVLGLREGTYIRVIGDTCILGGNQAGARLFQRGLTPVEYSKGADLSFLIMQNMQWNLEYEVSLEDRAQEQSDRLGRYTRVKSRQAMESETGQKVQQGLENAVQKTSEKAEEFGMWSVATFNKLKDKLSGKEDYRPTPDN
jgi:dipeptidase E